MNITKLKIFFIILLLIFLSPHRGDTQEDKKLYSQGIKAARSGDIDFAFMNFYRLLSIFPESEFSEDALFATGEYYFLIGDYYDAARTFNRFINNYPGSEAELFALIYLLEIAKIRGKEKLVKILEKEIVTSQRLAFLFRDFKEYKYLSPLFKSYKVVYFIDKVEFYIDGKLFTKISY